MHAGREPRSGRDCSSFNNTYITKSIESTMRTSVMGELHKVTQAQWDLLSLSSRWSSAPLPSVSSPNVQVSCLEGTQRDPVVDQQLGKSHPSGHIANWMFPKSLGAWVLSLTLMRLQGNAGLTSIPRNPQPAVNYEGPGRRLRPVICRVRVLSSSTGRVVTP
jgi:hypothetical protein